VRIVGPLTREKRAQLGHVKSPLRNSTSFRCRRRGQERCGRFRNALTPALRSAFNTNA
jgi:hypothetical protein